MCPVDKVFNEAIKGMRIIDSCFQLFPYKFQIPNFCWKKDSV